MILELLKGVRELIWSVVFVQVDHLEVLSGILRKKSQGIIEVLFESVRAVLACGFYSFFDSFARIFLEPVV